MEKRTPKIEAFVMAALVAGSALTLASAALPSVTPSIIALDVWGTVKVNGASAPVGTEIVARDTAGRPVGAFVVTSPGEFGLMVLNGDDPASGSVDEGLSPGEAVAFEVAGAPAVASPAVAWTFERDTIETSLTVTTTPPALAMTAPSSVAEGESFLVRVTSAGVAVAGATVTLGVATASTSEAGQATLVAPDVAADSTFSLSATKNGFTPATATLLVRNVPRLAVNAPASVTSGASFRASVLADGAPAEGATATFGSASASVPASGSVTFTAPVVVEQTVRSIVATWAGATTASASILIEPMPALSIEAPATVDEGAALVVRVTSAGAAVAGATVTLGEVGSSTNAAGEVALLAPEVDSDATIPIAAAKSGHADATASLLVRNVPRLVVNVPATVTSGASFDAIVLADGTPAQGATVSFDSATALVPESGTVRLTAPIVAEPSSIALVATRAGAISASASVLVAPLPTLAMEAPASVDEGAPFVVLVTSEGAAVEGALVAFADATAATGADGTAALTAPEVERDADHPIRATKSGHAEAAGSVRVLNVPRLSISAPGSARAGDAFVVTVLADGAPVGGATVAFGDATTLTDARGEARFPAPDVEEDATLALRATIPRAIAAESSIRVLALLPLALAHADSIEEGGILEVVATSGDAGVEGVLVTLGTRSGTTGADGRASLVAPTVNADADAGLSGARAGHRTATSTVRVVNVPVLALVAPEAVQSGREFEVLVTGDGSPLVGAAVSFGDARAETDALGRAGFRAPDVDAERVVLLSASGPRGTAVSRDVRVTPLPVLAIEAPASVVEGEALDVVVRSAGAPVQGALVTAGDATQSTDVQGRAGFVAPAVTVDGTLLVTAALDGYAAASRSITVADRPEPLVVVAPSTATEGERVSFVVSQPDGAPAAGALVTLGTDASTADALGAVTFLLPQVDADATLAWSASRERSVSVAGSLVVRDEPRLVLSAPQSAVEGAEVAITVSRALASGSTSPVAGASVRFAGVDVTTDAGGVARFTAPRVDAASAVAVVATATGFPGAAATVTIEDGTALWLRPFVDGGLVTRDEVLEAAASWVLGGFFAGTGQRVTLDDLLILVAYWVGYLPVPL